MHIHHIRRANFTHALRLCAVVATAAIASMVSAADRVVTAAEATGTWIDGSNKIEILAIGGGKLKVSLALVFEYKSSSGPTANTGDAAGEATITDNVAIFQPEESEACKITMTFLRRGKLEVEQEGDSPDCGFGHRVRADGTYRKISSRKPDL